MSDDQSQGGAKAAGPGDFTFAPQAQMQRPIQAYPEGRAGWFKKTKLVAGQVAADPMTMGGPTPSTVDGAPRCPPGYVFHSEDNTCRFEVGTRQAPRPQPAVSYARPWRWY